LEGEGGQRLNVIKRSSSENHFRNKRSQNPWFSTEKNFHSGKKEPQTFLTILGDVKGGGIEGRGSKEMDFHKLSSAEKQKIFKAGPRQGPKRHYLLRGRGVMAATY